MKMSTLPLPHPARRLARPFAKILATAAALSAALGAALLTPLAHAGLGLTELAPRGEDGPVTVYYPTSAAEQPLVLGQGVLRLSVARDAAPAAGNGRLVLVSHGSGGSPWVYADLARALVEAGYTVAVPRHRGDNFVDDGTPGPASWEQRPGEVTRAIDTVAADARFGPRLRLEQVGVYGMSAGGHTALTLAGGRWSPALFAQHCEQHLAEDFNACVGLATSLSGGWLDGFKLWLARRIISARFGSETALRSHADARIAAVVAAVPHATSFDMASLATPKVPLALATAQGDIWLHPRFHSGRVQEACAACEELPAAPAAGHGAYLSPLPAGFTGLLGRLVNDPPGFERASMAGVNARIVGFFDRQLTRAAAADIDAQRQAGPARALP